MGGFKWDAKAGELASDRFTALAADAAFLEPLVDDNIRSWRGGGQLLDILVPGHQAVANELWISSWCTPDMLESISRNLVRVATSYKVSDDASRVSIEYLWEDFGFDTSQGGDRNLEEHGGEGYDFGSDFPPHRPVSVEDFAFIKLVHKIIEFPDSMMEMQTKEPVNPAFKVIWREVLMRWDELARGLAERLTGDWEGINKAGDAMTSLGMYWRDLHFIAKHSAGTLFRHWDGEAAEHAERHVGLVCDLYMEAAGGAFDCSLAYHNSSYGFFILFQQLHDALTTIPVKLSNLLALMDQNRDFSNLPAVALSAVYMLVEEIFESFANVVMIVRMVLQAYETFVGLMFSISTLLAEYSNKMRGYVDA